MHFILNKENQQIKHSLNSKILNKRKINTLTLSYIRRINNIRIKQEIILILGNRIMRLE